MEKLLSHIGLIHQHESNFFITCNIHQCSRSYAKFESYRVHLYRHHRPLLDVQHGENEDLAQGAQQDVYDEMEVDEPDDNVEDGHVQ